MPSLDPFHLPEFPPKSQARTMITGTPIRPYRTRDAFEHEFHAVMEWLRTYNGNDKTYRQFEDEYQKAAKTLEGLFKLKELPEDLRTCRRELYNTIAGLGLSRLTQSGEPSDEEPIRDHQIPGGKPANQHRAPPRPSILRMLADIEFGNPGAQPTTLIDRIGKGRGHFATLWLSEQDAAWIERELQRMGSIPDPVHS